MNSLVFFDLEISPATGKILDIGAVRDRSGKIHTDSVKAFTDFIRGADYLGGHNILKHDLGYLSKALKNEGLDKIPVLDTLFLSPLLFPTKPYHALVKDDKLQTDALNNPLNDAQKAYELFRDELQIFCSLDRDQQTIYFSLLASRKEFSAFFKYIVFKAEPVLVPLLIGEKYSGRICENADLDRIIASHPVELAYTLALINADDHTSISPPWVLKNFPDTEQVMYLLRNKPCLKGCHYCNNSLDPISGLNQWFGYDRYRTFGGEPLQQEAVKAAVNGKSLLAVFPTGGGKSITFQVPALMMGQNSRALTVVISPLQSLMKDQVDNLEKLGITVAVTINGLLDPIERAQAFERVEDGSATLLYISPESLRSPSIMRLMEGRKIGRFVIDEAHCFSSWGQDFRVDYLYIGDFIRELQQRKGLSEPIPVSCFTATAKQKVIIDICDYFWEKLSLTLEVFSARASRTNLTYRVFHRETEQEKYNLMRDLLEERNCPSIVYVSRTRRAYDLAKRLSSDGLNAFPYHGKMDKQEKTQNQNAFMAGEVDIMVATSAFGMGVDKKDVGLVIHYEISDSLENYVQEAGRAGRDESIQAECFVLFSEEDLTKHFILLNQTRLSIKEIQQVWKAVKSITHLRSGVSNSALEIARKAGWDDNVVEIETRVTTAISALEESGYLRRGQNMPRIFANSILCKTAQEAIDKIIASDRFQEKQKEQAVRIIKKLIASRNRRKSSDETPESRIDYISDHLGIVKADVIRIINLLREEKILADTKDLTAFIKRGDKISQSTNLLEGYCQIERFLLSVFKTEVQSINIKEVNELTSQQTGLDCSPFKLKTIFNFWGIKNWFRIQRYPNSPHHLYVKQLQNPLVLEQKMEKRHSIAKFILELLFEKSIHQTQDDPPEREVLVEFSVHEIRDTYQSSLQMFKWEITLADVEDALFFLSRIEALKIEGGFLVVYNKLTIERLETDNRKKYKQEDYRKLQEFYENKIQQIHIVGEYARKMLEDYKDALQFVEDYFQLNYSSFLSKYFKGTRRSDISRNITPAKFRQMFGELSPAQLKVINDRESKHIVVAAGPGSGKTRVLVHKLASLLLMEDVKHEQLLMLTFSRAAATEFKKRLIALVGGAAQFVDIKTFHSYCFDLLGKVGTLEKADEIIREAVGKIKTGEVEPNYITKSVLVIDEAQDMNADEFSLVQTLMQLNENLRVIAVGDDDQNIFEFRGATSRYMHQFIQSHKATQYELVENYRSLSRLVDYANQIVHTISARLKRSVVMARQSQPGEVVITRYDHAGLLVPVAEEIAHSDRRGSLAALTHTNEEALQLTGILLSKGVAAKLMQSNDGFNLFNLFEIRTFLNILQEGGPIIFISQNMWDESLRKWTNLFKGCSRKEVILKILDEFHRSHPRSKYFSDLVVFVRESKLEDFISDNGDTVLVSTMHKAKGKEFDQVWVMLSNFSLVSDERKRQLYVAVTRARNFLSVHHHGNLPDPLPGHSFTMKYCKVQFPAPGRLTMHLSFKDVWLDFFIHQQKLVKSMQSGQALVVDEEGCRDQQGRKVLLFSRQFQSRMQELNQSGLHPKEASISFMVFWKKEDTPHEYLILLPEIVFERA